MIVKIRRYMFNPIMGRSRVQELLLLILCSFCIASLYVYFNSSEDSRQDLLLVNNIDNAIVQGVSGVSRDEVEQRRPPIRANPVKENSSLSADVIAVLLVFCATRPDAITNHLTQVLKHRPSPSAFPVIVSQDGDNGLVKTNVMKFADDPANNIQFMRHEREPSFSRAKNYHYIAAHYKWAIDKVFANPAHDYVIITEDDLDIAPDFFSYFTWAKKAMQVDPTIWCASAWNDNGIPSLVDSSKPSLVWRCDFFPGLGWMMSRALWTELSPKFPEAYWDDWMRLPEVRRNRTCIRPEIPRTSHNMQVAGKGSSNAMFRSFLDKISHADKAIDFSLLPVDSVVKQRFDASLRQNIIESQLVKIADIDTAEWNPQHSYKIVYNTTREWVDLSKKLGIMVDIRGGMQRTVYQGVVPLMFRDCRLYLIHSSLDVQHIENYVYNTDWDKESRHLDFAAVYCKPTRFTGKCDPYSDEMIAWFKQKGWSKRLAAWSTMIVN